MVDIRALQKNDDVNLSYFFEDLSDETLRWQNHFGDTREHSWSIAGKEILRGDERNGYVAIDNEKIVAYGWLDFGKKPEQRYTCSMALVVADKFQGKGIGKQLCEYMISEAKKLGMRKIWLNVYSKNFRALKMYDKLGFIEEGVFRKQEWTKDNLPLDLYSLALFL